MEKEFFESEVQAALEVLRKGGNILYPTDTIWGIGCDATQSEAVQKIYQIKKREDSKSMIILLADERDIIQYIAAPDPEVFDFIHEQQRPTTIIFDHAIGLPDSLLATDGSIAIRLVKDLFCRHLIRRLQKPIVSTSANISGDAAPANFREINPEIKSQVDHVVKWRQDEDAASVPSRIIRWKGKGKFIIIRN
jgi:L-threonylcarbamoyladenylate synthase